MALNEEGAEILLLNGQALCLSLSVHAANRRDYRLA
jgi:hypothetical protein